MGTLLPVVYTHNRTTKPQIFAESSKKVELYYLFITEKETRSNHTPYNPKSREFVALLWSKWGVYKQNHNYRSRSSNFMARQFSDCWDQNKVYTEFNTKSCLPLVIYWQWYSPVPTQQMHSKSTQICKCMCKHALSCDALLGQSQSAHVLSSIQIYHC